MAEINRIASINPIKPISQYTTRVQKSEDSPNHRHPEDKVPHDKVEIENLDEESSPPIVQESKPEEEEHIDLRF